VSRYTKYEHEGKSYGGEKMSILLHAPSAVKKFVVKPKHDEPKTSSILLISLAIFVAIILLMYVGILWTESSIKGYSTCRDKIIGFEQRGMYTNSDQFKLALSYCDR
jgi:hypothetical protein